jgi:hypothetical protein
MWLNLSASCCTQDKEVLVINGRFNNCACISQTVWLLDVSTCKVQLYCCCWWWCWFRFNDEFNQLVRQKHKDADRLADLASRMDELIKELVKIQLMLAPPAPAPQPSSATAVTDQASTSLTTDGLTLSPGTEGSMSTASAVANGSSGGAGGSEAELSGSELAAQLGAGRLVAHWSPLEDLEEQLLRVKPGEVKVRLTHAAMT